MTVVKLALPSQLHTTPPGTGGNTLDVPVNGQGRPLIWDPGKGKLVAYTRMTTYVDCVEDKASIAHWNERLVLAGALGWPEVAERARGLDPSADRDEMNRVVDHLKGAAGAHARSDRGTRLHSLTELLDRGEPLPTLVEDEERDLAAYRAATACLRVEAVERRVVLDDLKVTGTFDRLVWFEGPGPLGEPVAGRFIADLKTGKIGFGQLRIAGQLARYSRGVLYDPQTRVRTEMEGVNQDWGIVIHLPAGAGECTLHWVDLRLGWEVVMLAQRIREIRSKARKAISPFNVREVTPLGLDSLGGDV